MPSRAGGDNRRKHVTSACVPCRDSKVKCDALLPECSNCKKKGRDCRYQAGDDRRKLSVRVAVELLVGRVDSLCQFARENSLEPPPMSAADAASLKRVLGHLRLNQALPRDISTPEKANSENRAASDISHSSSPSQGETPYKIHVFDSKLPTVATEGNNILSSVEPGGYSNAQVTNIEAEVPFTEGYLNLESGITTGLGDPLYPWVNHDDVGLDSQPSYPFGTDPLAGLFPFQEGAPDLPPQRGFETSLLPPPKEPKNDVESMEILLDKLSDRIGSLQIGPGGDVRYYGPTSNFNLVEMPAPDKLTVHRTVRNNGQEYLDRLGLSKRAPAELQEHLESLFFAWHDPVLHVVDRAMFEQARVAWRDRGEDTPYYSEALQNAVCALGAAFEARHYPKFVTFPKSLPDFFADRAKALLEIELDSPCVATVQAMVVLSSHDIGCKRDARGWLYSGMAMRLAFDLALHVDMTPYVSKGSMTQAEANLRRDVFWGAYTVDHMWGFFLGRPFRINMEDVTVARPAGNTVPSSAGLWIPYTSPQSNIEHEPLPDWTDELHRQRVMLCEIMAPVGYILYGSFKIPPHQLQKMNEKRVRKLIEWQANVPLCLQVDVDDKEKKYLPHVLILHMQYHQNIIHAHRPWMSRTLTQPNPPQGAGAEHARMMCIESAITIAKLLQLYDSLYGFRRMSIQGVGITCSAALLLMFAVVTSYKHEGMEDASVYLACCFRALDEFGVAWESAKRAQEFFILLQRQWEHQRRSARGRQNTSGDLVPQKRRRPESLDRQLQEDRSDKGASAPHLEQGLRGASVTADTDRLADLDWILADGDSDECFGLSLGLQNE